MILVRASQEMGVADSFRRQGIRVYWPNYEKYITVSVRQSRTHRERVIFSPIIPGYLFTPTDECGDLPRLIERTIGAISVALTFSGEPLLLREDDIQIIRKIEAGLNTPSPLSKSLHKFKVGDKVRFVDDDLGRWPPGRVSRCSQEGRISIEVALMGRIATVVVFPHQIARL
jgi:transcription antitermination factor NusG